jgi:O-antigen/teichoic acid export membrane protein
MSRTRRSAWNLITGFILTGLTVLTGFAGTPWILHWLGAERFGAYRVLMDWFGYLTILDLGVIGSVTARLGPKVGAGDEEGVSAVLTAGLRVYFWISLAMLGGGLLLVLGIPHFMELRSVTPGEIRIAAAILLIPVAWVPFSVFRALTEARQKGYLVNLLLSLQALLTTGLLIVTAWSGWGLIGQAVATSVAMIPLPFSLLVMGLRRHRHAIFAPPDPAAMRDLRALNWPTFWFNMSGRLGLYSDNIAIGWILGPSSVTRFFLTQRLAQIAQTQLQGLGNATWAGLVELYSQGHTERFCARMTELTTLVSGLGLAVLIPIAAYNRHFITLWVGSGSYAGDWVNGIACFNIWMWAIASLWNWPISGAGHIAKWVPYAIAFLIINVAVTIGATFIVGLPGPLVGTFVAFLAIQSWGVPRVLGQVFHHSLFSIWKTAAAQLLWGGPYAIVLWFIGRSHRPWGWSGLAVEASLGLAGGLCLWWLSLGAGLRQEWRIRFRSML